MWYMRVYTQRIVGWVMNREEKEALLTLMNEKAERIRYNKIKMYYPEKGALRRELYPKHIECLNAGKDNRQRLIIAANRIGKTEGVGLYELTCHLTGVYPHWWKGKVWERPIKAWCCGDTGKTIREIIQPKILGDVGDFGSGLIPKSHLARITRGSGVADSVDTIYVKHVSGGLSSCVLKSYDQRRVAFQGSEIDFIHLDEEPPMDIYVECLIRTMTNDGALLLTFTPLGGMSEVVLSFIPNADIEKALRNETPGKHVTMATWDDVPHLTKEVKDEFWSQIPPFQREARTKGIPSLGSGLIYPVSDSDIIVPHFNIPDNWKRVYGLDVGWNKTAAVWRATNPETGVDFLYSEHYQSAEEPSVHAESIKGRGKWIPGVIDPASRGRSQNDGTQLVVQYNDLGLNLSFANNAVEAGTYLLWQQLSSGKLKVFSTLSNWFNEKRQYSRDEKGKIIKKDDHLMDATRYVQMSGGQVAKVDDKKDLQRTEVMLYLYGGSGWMG